MTDENKVKTEGGAKVVKNTSTGYGYKYSNLADLAKAGVKIPKMRIKPTEFGEYIEYLDEQTGDWFLGARIVTFTSKGMNEAQAYGAALTYARRYTVQMAESVACDDDDAVEKAKPIGQNGQGRPNFQKSTPASDKQIDFLKSLLVKAGKSAEDIESTVEQARKATSKQISAWIEKARELAGSEGLNG